MNKTQPSEAPATTAPCAGHLLREIIEDLEKTAALRRNADNEEEAMCFEAAAESITEKVCAILTAQQGYHEDRKVSRSNIFQNISEERELQDDKFGQDRNSDPFQWLAILGEEVGEANEAALHVRYDHDDPKDNLRDELIQVAAVAVAFVECIDRSEWEWEEYTVNEVNEQIYEAQIDIIVCIYRSTRETKFALKLIKAYQLDGLSESTMASLRTAMPQSDFIIFENLLETLSAAKAKG